MFYFKEIVVEICNRGDIFKFLFNVLEGITIEIEVDGDLGEYAETLESRIKSLSCYAFSDNISECLSGAETTTGFEVSSLLPSTQPSTFPDVTTDLSTTAPLTTGDPPTTTVPPITTSEVTSAPLLDWASWAECSVTCGDGKQTRERPDCSYAAEVCTEEQDCNLGTCPGWGDWRPWGMCSGMYLHIK